MVPRYRGSLRTRAVHRLRRGWREGDQPRGTRTSEPRAGHSAGEACQASWSACEKQQRRSGRRGSRRCFTTSRLRDCGRATWRCRTRRQPEWLESCSQKLADGDSAGVVDGHRQGALWQVGDCGEAVGCSHGCLSGFVKKGARASGSIVLRV